MDNYTYQSVGSQGNGPGDLFVWLVWMTAVVAALLILAYLLRRYIRGRRERAMFQENQSFSHLVKSATYNMTGFDFEVWVRELLLSIGIRAETTPRFNDHGIDVIARHNGKKIGIQCKKYYARGGGWMVGEPTVRDLYGVKFADGYDIVMLITTGNFSSPAMEWAKGKKDLMLINAKLLERIILDRSILKKMLE